MPSECRKCFAMDYGTMTGETYCKVNGKTLAESYRPIEFNGRPDWCPLVELPEKHGKLVEFIDVATFEDEDSGTEEVNLGEAFAAYFKMREAKPVIEAEGEG